MQPPAILRLSLSPAEHRYRNSMQKHSPDVGLACRSFCTELT